MWANTDVYTLDIPNLYKIDERQETLIANKGHTYKWETDSYGNEFAVIKKIKPFSQLTPDDFKEPEAFTRCTILDGSNFIMANNRPPDYLYSVNEHSDPPWRGCLGGVNANCNIRDGSTFLQTECTFFETVQPEGTNIPVLQGNRVFCTTLDGYIFAYTAADGVTKIPFEAYRLYSTNQHVDRDGDISKNPLVDQIWDGGVFDQTCVDAILSETFYKLEDTDTFSTDTYEYNTTEFSVTDTSETKSLTDQINLTGDIFVRNMNSSSIGTFDSVCNRMYARYDTNIQDDITNNTLDVDIIDNIIIIKTENYYIIDKIMYDYDSNIIESTVNPSVVERTDTDRYQYRVSDYFYNEADHSITICKLYKTDVSEFVPTIEFHVIDIDTFTTRQVTPILDEDMQNITMTVDDIKTPIVTYCPESEKYYISFICYYSNVAPGTDEPLSFAIAQYVTYNRYGDTIDFDVYRTSTLARDQFLNADDQDSWETKITGSPGGTGFPDYLVTFINAPVAFLTLNLLDALPGKSVLKIDIDWGDGTSEVINRHPVTDYSNFEFDTVIGQNLRDPRSYKIKHKYTAPSAKVDTTTTVAGIEGAVDTIECIVTLYTMEDRNPAKYRISITRGMYDITTSFDSIDIYDTKVYVDEYGNENMLTSFITKKPEYITTVVLKLITDIREGVQFKYANNDVVSSHNIDMTAINTVIN